LLCLQFPCGKFKLYRLTLMAIACWFVSGLGVGYGSHGRIALLAGSIDFRNISTSDADHENSTVLDRSHQGTLTLLTS